MAKVGAIKAIPVPVEVIERYVVELSPREAACLLALVGKCNGNEFDSLYSALYDAIPQKSRAAFWKGPVSEGGTWTVNCKDNLEFDDYSE